MQTTQPPTKSESDALVAYEAALLDAPLSILALVRTDSEWAERLIQK